MFGVAQPAGTVTLVFTDVEGSTGLLDELGEAGYRDALAVHRQACGRRSASTAGTRSTTEEGPIAVRIGMHTGAPLPDPPKYIGPDVHKAARSPDQTCA
jgi:class 3 adenylate cyclase